MGIQQKNRGFRFNDSEYEDLEWLRGKFYPFAHNLNDVMRLAVRLLKNMVAMHGSLAVLGLLLQATEKEKAKAEESDGSAAEDTRLRVQRK